MENQETVEVLAQLGGLRGTEFQAGNTGPIAGRERFGNAPGTGRQFAFRQVGRQAEFVK